MSAHLKKCRIVNFRTNRAISNIFRSVMARDGRKWCSGPSWWFAEVPRSPDLCRMYITLQKLPISVGARRCFGTSPVAVSLCMYCVARGVQVCHHTVALKNRSRHRRKNPQTSGAVDSSTFGAPSSAELVLVINVIIIPGNGNAPYGTDYTREWWVFPGIQYTLVSKRGGRFFLLCYPH